MDITIEKSEVLKYLKMPEEHKYKEIEKTISETIKEVTDISRIRYIYKKYFIKINDDGLELLNTNLTLKGKSIKKHLINIEEIYLMALTLGSEVDKRILYYEKKSLSKSLIFDACATAAIEEACNVVEKKSEIKLFLKGIQELLHALVQVMVI